MLFNILGRMIDNGFSFKRALQDEFYLRHFAKKYPQLVDSYLGKIKENYGLLVEEFEVYSERGLQISFYKNNKIIELVVFEEDFYTTKDKIKKFSVEDKILDRNLLKDKIGDLTIININTYNYKIENKQIKLFDNKDDVLKELENNDVMRLLSEFKVSPLTARKQWKLAIQEL